MNCHKPNSSDQSHSNGNRKKSLSLCIQAHSTFPPAEQAMHPHPDVSALLIPEDCSHLEEGVSIGSFRENVSDTERSGHEEAGDDHPHDSVLYQDRGPLEVA